MRYDLLITEPNSFNPNAKQILSSFCNVVEGKSTTNILPHNINNFDILFIRLHHKFDRELLEKCKRLRYLVSPTTGLDHIDLQAAKNLGIKVLSLQGETDFLKEISATAELAWGLLISLLRSIPWAFEDVKEGNWDRDSFRGHEISSKRLGILGLGRLGEKVARYAITFGMSVVAYDPYCKKWPNEVEKANNLHQLLSNCDVLSIHVPLTQETEGMLGDKELKMMPRGSWIINTSRGKILNEDALLTCLLTGHIAGAGLDVLIDENQGTKTMIQNELIRYSINHRNLLISPHIGGATIESMQKTELFMALKLKQILCDQKKL